MKAASEAYVELYKNLDQTKWAEESKLIVQHISKKAKIKYIYFPDLMQYVAQERQRLATMLGTEKHTMVWN
ncbi:hypothetical protein [Legionella maioricensis]|uniref:Uncharacterized protein n=1 Tax=Legionella maioricensis TaxID=2896528 RepID=A0A9X2D097_9GAMM|nr:hypothetical protein [Legionella maioricensis]MCL9684220.1 hypothetical protein [Legionella maioricensis]MCL9687086.1 hypothetical protein [Legionella maioricensis]